RSGGPRPGQGDDARVPAVRAEFANQRRDHRMRLDADPRASAGRGPDVPTHDVERDRSARRTDASGRGARKIRAVQDDPPLRRDVSKPPMAGMTEAWRARVRS